MKNMMLRLLVFTFASIIVFFQAAMTQGTPTNPVALETTTNSLMKPYSLMFTTEAYHKEALKLLISEANRVAEELQLPEKSPITDSSLVRLFIPPYGMARRIGAIGAVTTTNYTYYVSVNNKFSFLEGTHQDADRQRWYQEYSWPVSRLDTNGAYQLATQWLKATSMDVDGLNNDCNLHVEPSALRGQGTNACFLPVYWVYWTKGEEGRGSVASVELFAPTKTLMQLRVEDSDYILRNPVIITNLGYLLSQTNTVDVPKTTLNR
jgi:hypothetical protein